MSLAIETHNLGKRYGDVTAVHDLSLNVREGEIYAFLGLNGAGKTTTIRLLLGMIKPTAGYVDVLQTRIQPGRRQPWASVGYMVEEPHAYPELTVRENLEVARRLHPGVPPKAVSEAIEQMSLTAYADRQARTLSHGNAQRLGLAKALLHDPRLLILDEPSNGLDPAGIVEIRELLQNIVRQHNVTVFMSSHILAEVARLADRIGIIHKGRLIQELSISELERDRKRLLVLAVRQPALARTALEAAGYTPLLQADGAIVLENASAIDAPDMIASLLVQAGAPPTRLMVEEEELEQYFLRLVGLEAGVQNE
jgi:ABC-2 type transport system ATP-binding protein